MRQECRERFPPLPISKETTTTCVTHVPWCMSGSLTCGDGENVPGIPGACAPAILRIWQEAHWRQTIIWTNHALVYWLIYAPFARMSLHTKGGEFSRRPFWMTSSDQNVTRNHQYTWHNKNINRCSHHYMPADGQATVDVICRHSDEKARAS